MAERWPVAFGRYLRMLRERRRLSLHDVESLSRTFPDPINRGTLSRCENGLQKIAFSKLVALSRIYQVPSEVLVERMELDMELERVGGPDTAGLNCTELTALARSSIRQGMLWRTYAYLRDAVPVAEETREVPEGFRDSQELILNACMNYSTAAGRLGRHRLSLHELEHVLNAGGLGPSRVPLLMERLSVRYRALGDLERATAHAERAIGEAERLDLPHCLGYAYSSRARLAHEQAQLHQAVQLYQKAFAAFKEAGLKNDCAQELANLAQAYYDMKRYRSARRALEASERMATLLELNRTRALVRILLGELEEREGRAQEATRCWREAVEIARRLQDRTVRFKAEYLLYRQAVNTGKEPAARAIERRLRKIEPWIPQDVEELHLFRTLAARRASQVS